ncbi:hypothetical protein ACIQOW_34390 [Kitasatospora sp. NPDC091335]|uniref:hypothetical protein n=1 Tax=Streptomycetaceae TaxID=2062 RepID=UPI0016620954|nr:hypothetical protein [Streptomyces sp. CBMA156]MBD0675251.1 hypothetical protein [Streptomyces sp. CBMA156]
MKRQPMKPSDPRIRSYTEMDVLALVGELHERGRKFGLLFPYACTDRTRDGRVLVRFANAPVSTLLNLLTLLLDADRERSCGS